jgi:hypothetical protein
VFDSGEAPRLDDWVVPDRSASERPAVPAQDGVHPTAVRFDHAGWILIANARPQGAPVGSCRRVRD